MAQFGESLHFSTRTSGGAYHYGRSSGSKKVLSIFHWNGHSKATAKFLMVVYNYIWDRGGAERRWTLMGLVSKMLLSVGLRAYLLLNIVLLLF